MTDFNAKVRDLVDYAYTHAPAVKQLLDDAGVAPSDIQTTVDLAKIPVLSKDTLVEIHQKNPPFGGFLTIDPADLPRIYISPGPIFDPQPPIEDIESALAPFRFVGFQRGDRVLNTFAYHLTPAGMMLDQGLRACNATVLPTGPGNTELQIHMAMSLGATGFVGQPSYLMTILDKAESMGLNPQTFPVKKAVFSSEPYLQAQKERIEGAWGMRASSVYGTADLGFVAYTRNDLQGFLVTQNCYMQVVDTQTGEDMPAGSIGEVVVTTFQKAYPLIRFGTGDLGAMSPHLVEGQQHLLGLFGRSGEAVKVRGMFLHPNQLRMAAMQFPQIERFQAIITRPENRDFVTLKIQLKDGASENGLGQILQELAEKAVRLKIDIVEFTEVNPNERSIKDERIWD